MKAAGNIKATLRKRLFIGLHLLAGSHLARFCGELYDLESVSTRYLEKLQQIRLARILEHAVRNVPYYRERVGRNNRPSLADFPVLAKADIRNNFEGLMSEDFHKRYSNGSRPSFFGWSVSRTSGSDSESTFVIHDREMRERGRAGRLYSLDLAGIPFGERHFRLLGAPSAQAGLAWTRLSKAVVLDCSSLDQERMLSHLDSLDRSDIQFMVSFGDSAWRLASFALREGRPVRPLKRILVASTPLTPGMRATLETVFGAEVRNQYGHRECANIACECDRGGMHVLSGNLLVEVVDDSGKPLKQGKTGNILVTQLFNYSFPLIRLRIEDIGSLSRECCACGRPFPLLGNIEGRAVEVIRGTDGRCIPAGRMDKVFGDLENSLSGRCQLVQTARSRYELKFVSGDSMDVAVIHRAPERVRRLLGNEAEILVRRVDSIPLSASGKIVRTLNFYSSKAIDRQESSLR